ncbi:MAG: phosphatidylglycerophosphatase A, partial [Kiritimatiellae bacterium]|nr:phosphatidylglycerophosphatase A [Kiritimatiellia bacterium]
WMLYPIATIGLPLCELPWMLLSTFIVIRILDVMKLPPARQIQYLPEGWGIVADDFASQLYALAVNWGVYWAILNWC